MISATRYQLRLETNRQVRLSQEIARAQAEISTNKRILAPSDDPAAAARIADITRSQANHATWRGNLDKARALFVQADGVLTSLQHTYTRASELVLTVANGTLSRSDRQGIAVELRSLADHVDALSATRDSRGDLLFARGETTAIPVGADLTISAVAKHEAVFGPVVTTFGTLDLAQLLRSSAGSVVGGAAAPIATCIQHINDALTHVAAIHAEHGTRGNRIDALVEQSELFAIAAEDERIDLENVNIQEVIARLQAKKLSLEAAQAVFARTNRSTLFDFIA